MMMHSVFLYTTHTNSLPAMYAQASSASLNDAAVPMNHSRPVRMPGMRPPIDALLKTGGIEALSEGRLEPVAPQALVVLNTPMNRDRPPMEPGINEANSLEFYAPLGTDETANIPRRGNWVLFRADEEAYRIPRDASMNVVDLHLVCVMNGISVDVPLRAGGIITNAQDLGNPNRDDIGVINIAGHNTGINTGPYDINAGDTVYLCPWAFQIMDDAGTCRPGITVDGESKQKYFPATISFRDTDMYCFFRKIREIALDLVSSQKHFINEKKIDELIRNNVDIPSSSSAMWRKHPVVWYARIYTAVELLRVRAMASAGSMDNQVVNEQANDYHFEALKLVAGQLETFYGEKQLSGEKFASNVESMFKNAVPVDLRKYTPASGFATKVNKAKNGQRLIATVELTKLAEEACTLCVQQQTSWMRRFALGTATSHSAPGKQLDVMLGYFQG